jgi:hypothetical protein
MSCLALAETPRVTGPAAPAQGIRTLGIPTRDRTESLRRCVATHLESARRHGRALDCAVIDDSGDPAVREHNRAALRALRDSHDADIYYAGPEERARFAAALVRGAELPPQAVHFALLNPEGCPVSTGASRNALLLHTAGDMLLHVDDDTLGNLLEVPGARPGLALSSRHDPTEFWFLGQDGALPCGSRPVEADLLALHEQLLGRSPSACVAAAGAAGAVDCGQATAAFVRKLDAGAGRVAVTAAGVVGDSGMGSSVYFLSLDGASRERLLRGRDDYRHALASHRVLRAVTRTTVCERALCVAINLGLDNRQLLPPFLPVQRNSDGVFAALVSACLGDALFGFLPAALWHQRPTPRPAGAGDVWDGAARVRTGQLITVLIRAAAPQAGGADGVTNLRTLGCTLAHWGSLPPGEFDQLVRSHLATQLGHQVGLLAARLRQFGGRPEFWADDVRRVLALLQEDLTGKRCPAPCDLVEAFGMDTAGELSRRLVLRLGQMLQCWPDMVEAARDLRAHGVRLAERL